MDPFKSIKSLIKPGQPTLPNQVPLGPAKGPLLDPKAQQREDEAFRVLREGIANNFKTFFQGAHFVAAEEAGGTVVDIAQTAADIASDCAEAAGKNVSFYGLSSSLNPLDVVFEFAKKLTGAGNNSEVMQIVGVHTMVGLYSSIVPYLGCVKSGVDAAKSLYGAVKDVQTHFQAIEAVQIVNPNGSKDALDAVARLLDRRANDGFTKGAIQAVETVVNTALAASGVAGAASSGVSIASKIAVLSVIIRRRALEYREMKKGRDDLNLAANQPVQYLLTPAVFNKCPLLGCYLLTGSNTSAIIFCPLVNGRPGKGWMDQFEKNKKYMDPILDKAKGFVIDSMWRVEGPNISSKAWIADKRPWVERFWISRFGATGKMYRVISTGRKAVDTTSSAYQAITQPVQKAAAAGLQELMKMAASGKEASA
jgi:hypothetical protein